MTSSPASGHDLRLDRVSWLRGSNAFLNAALTSDAARILLLDRGNPLVHKTEARRKQVWFASWSEVQSAILASVDRPEYGVFGPEPYNLRMREGSPQKVWLASTQGLISPLLSLAFLGIETGEDRPVFPAEPGLHVPRGTPYFVLSLTASPQHTRAWSESYDVLDMRMAVAFGSLAPQDTAIVGMARSLIDWNERRRHCPSCGSKQYSALSGHKRVCGTALVMHAHPCTMLEIVGRVPSQECMAWRSLHNYTYPRTDPVVLVGIVCDDKFLLARKRGWPKGYYSCIAYVYSCSQQRVCGTGRIDRGGSTPGGYGRDRPRRRPRVVPMVRTIYLPSSQPWSFPAQLMLGLLAFVKSANAQVRLDLDNELEEAFFATKEQVQTILSSRNSKNSPGVLRHGHKLTYVSKHSHSAYLAPEPWPTNSCRGGRSLLITWRCIVVYNWRRLQIRLVLLLPFSSPCLAQLCEARARHGRVPFSYPSPTYSRLSRTMRPFAQMHGAARFCPILWDSNSWCIMASFIFL